MSGGDAGVMWSCISLSTLSPAQMRWQPSPAPAKPTTFLEGIVTMSGAGDPCSKTGMGVHVYSCNTSMERTAFYNSDGDMLIVPQEGALEVRTELGPLRVAPQEIVVIPRGVRFAVSVEGPSRGYICELFQGHFALPNLGPIGANGLANARDFLYPTAAYVDEDEEWEVLNRYGGAMHSTVMKHCPFNVVAWHGNYAPFKYDLGRFNTMNSVTFDHPDPSIYTVLTAPTDTPGVAVCDFVIFPHRWMVMNHSFRPPYFHRNCMSEYMGMISGKYDAKVGFVPGGSSLHSCMTPHGPDAPTFLKASSEHLQPQWFDKGLAFMFESTYMLKLTQHALTCSELDKDYFKCWQQLPKIFDPATPHVTVPESAAAEAVAAAAAEAGAAAKK